MSRWSCEPSFRDREQNRRRCSVAPSHVAVSSWLGTILSHEVDASFNLDPIPTRNPLTLSNLPNCVNRHALCHTRQWWSTLVIINSQPTIFVTTSQATSDIARNSQTTATTFQDLLYQTAVICCTMTGSTSVKQPAGYSENA